VRRVDEDAVDVGGPADRVQRPAIDLGSVDRALGAQPGVRRCRIGQHLRVRHRVVDHLPMMHDDIVHVRIVVARATKIRT
jgi:hypothetical protein